MRLPISPFGQFVFHFKFNIRSLYITLRLMSNFIYIILFYCNWKNIWSVYVLNFYTYSSHNYDHKLFGSLYNVKQTNYNKTWCPMSDSNWRPHDYKSSALPTELIGQFVFHFKFNIRSLYIIVCLVSNFIYNILFGAYGETRTLNPYRKQFLRLPCIPFHHIRINLICNSINQTHCFLTKFHIIDCAFSKIEFI